MNSARAAAARVLREVLRGRRTLDADLIREFANGLAPRDAAFVQELCYGVARHYLCLNDLAGALLERPLRTRDEDVRALLLCGLYQLRELGTPEHAAVMETAEGARLIRKEWAVPLLNAVLRRYQRERETLDARVAGHPPCRHALAAWMLEAIARDWPDDWQTVAAASAARPPQHLRVNLSRISRAEYLGRLHAAGIEARAVEFVESGILIPEAVPVEALPGFAEGLASIQDFGAQLAAGLLEVCKDERVLDACAAPGGKSAHIYESCPGLGELVAVESDPVRFERLGQTLSRTGARVHTVCADVARPSEWWDGRPFDRILLDAPCSALGVMRRHPDIRINRTHAQCEKLAAVQDRLLEALWPLLRQGGRLLYATCSLLSLENDARIEKFLSVHKDVTVVNMTSLWGKATKYGRQTLPGIDPADGFYYALLARR